MPLSLYHVPRLCHMSLACHARALVRRAPDQVPCGHAQTHGVVRVTCRQGNMAWPDRPSIMWRHIRHVRVCKPPGTPGRASLVHDRPGCTRNADAHDPHGVEGGLHAIQ